MHKQYKNETRQQICNNLGKISGSDLISLKKYMDLLMELDGTLKNDGKINTAQLIENINRYNIIRMLMYGLLKRDEIELICHLAKNLCREREEVLKEKII